MHFFFCIRCLWCYGEKLGCLYVCLVRGRTAALRVHLHRLGASSLRGRRPEAVKPLLRVIVLVCGEFPVRADDGDGGVLRLQLRALRGGGGKCAESVRNEVVEGHVGKRLVVVFEVRARGLRASAYRHGLVGVEVSRGARLVQVGLSVVSCHQAADAVRAAARAHGVALVPVSDGVHQTRHRDHSAEHVPVVHALGAHVVRKLPRVAGNSRNGHARLVVELEHLFLVRRQLLLRRPLQGNKDNVRVAPRADGRAALLHSLHGVLDLIEAAFVGPPRDVGVILVHGGGRRAWGMRCTALLCV
eukprot:Rhum_TRINITY_DN20710_c0_g1::Rhum_TRINITY_DN20710_c0_g1_i1::g.171904::m.171904